MKRLSIQRGGAGGITRWTAAILLVGCVVSLSACSLVRPAHVIPSAEVKADLQVVEEANDGNWLYVLAKVRMPEPLGDADNVVVEATGLSGANTVLSERKAVKPGDIVKDSGVVGAEYLVPFKLPATGLTDYQLQLAWGDEAKPLISGQELIGGLKLEGFGATPNQGYLVGSIANSGSQIVNKVVLLVEYGPLDSSTGVHQNAELIDLVGLGLKPGTTRKITLQIPAGVAPKVSISDAA